MDLPLTKTAWLRDMKLGKLVDNLVAKVLLIIGEIEKTNWIEIHK